jgi:tetrahydromethanopterin S-methyltransferase subunit G
MEAFILTYGIVTVEIFRTTEYFNKIQNKLQRSITFLYLLTVGSSILLRTLSVQYLVGLAIGTV